MASTINSPGAVHPEIGILSQTLSPSQTTKWILPARIRSPSKDDLVFVSDTSIQLREFVSHGQVYLADVTAKLDLQTQILAAKVISARLEPIPILEATLEQTLEEARYMFDDQVVPDDEPPQLLVLSTSASDLVFIYAKDCYDGSVSFRCARRPLLGGIDLPSRFCSHMAVDPQCRALASAPANGYCSVFALKPVNEIRQEIDAFVPNMLKSFKPFKEQRLIQVDGFIIRIEFLKPSKEDPEKVILVLLVANAGETFLLLYRWDTRLPLHRLKPMRCSGQQLPPEDGLPLMLIPSMKPLSFLLVTESELVLYSTVTASRAEREAHPFRMDKSSSSDDQPRSLLWTQWAKPKRHLLYSQDNDDLFLMREDGHLVTYLIEYNHDFRVRMHFSPGGLGFRVDTAFCLLAGPRSLGGDILVAGGDMADGGVFHLGARKPPELVQVLPTNVPFNDLLLYSNMKGTAPSSGLHSSIGDLYAACGRTSSQGCVIQLRFGFEAQIGLTMEHSDSASIQQMWTIENVSDGGLLLLSSHVMHSSAVNFNLARMEVEQAEPSSWPGLDLENPTLAAGLTHPETLFQVTKTGVGIVSMRTKEIIHRASFESTIGLCADISGDGRVVVTALSKDMTYCLLMHRIQLTAPNDISLVQGFDLSIAARPICLRMAQLAGVDLLVVGMEQSRVGIYALRTDQTLVSLMELSLQDVDATLQETVVSSLALLSVQQSNVGVLLCGLRNGQLLSLHVTPNRDAAESRLSFGNGKLHTIGATTVTLSQDLFEASRGGSAAFAFCESTVKHIEFVQHGSLVNYAVSDVTATSREDSSMPPPICSAVQRISSLSFEQSAAASGLLVLATPDDLLFTNLVRQKHAIAQRFPMPGIPKRLMWSHYMKQLVVAVESDSPASSTVPSDIEDDSARSYPRLHFSNIISDDRTRAALEQQIVIGERRERIRALAEYSPTDGSRHFEMILVALSSASTDEYGALQTTGRVICISTKHVSRGDNAQARPRAVLRFPTKAVTAICPIGRSSVLISAGNEILMHDLDVSSRKWSTLARYTLPSPASSVVVQGSLAYVATAKHSLLVLRANNGVIKLEASDSIARVSAHVVPFDKSKILLTSISDSGTRLSGFDEDRRSNNIHELLQANIPGIVHHLVRQGDNLTSSNERPSFIGGTLDGTLYQFKTLCEAELQLAKFLEGLCRHEKPPRNPSLRPRKSKSSRSGAFSPAPNLARSTHCNGDILASMLEPGANNLASLLTTEIKMEDVGTNTNDAKAKREALQQIARPVIGEHEDIVGATLLWLHRLLA